MNFFNSREACTLKYFTHNFCNVSLQRSLYAQHFYTFEFLNGCRKKIIIMQKKTINPFSLNHSVRELGLIIMYHHCAAIIFNLS